ncbi:hypothetical protein KI655_10365 [Vibrio sp. D404a]|uniref:hypothetical protein n=1 Tax=unclassified Vibrio TaxID=2614977 RepID=UPI0025567B34|nr:MULTISPECIES: hypothetical protein [unclassified Vibrio]MDK9737706.1 hypothetical protein [Vibrio sp. D404a]MDK9795308.1 hypothetical protein [Vibrio sp. D449a]
MKKDIISFDVDGILVDYPKCWLNYLTIKTGLKFDSVECAKSKLSKVQYSQIKDEYRLGCYKYQLEIFDEMLKLNSYLYEKGYLVIISTSRPIEDSRFPNMKSNMCDWLHSKGFKFEHIVHKPKNEDSYDYDYGRIAFHIDDELKYAQRFANNNVNCILLTNTSISSSKIRVVKSIDEVVITLKEEL